MVIENDFLTTTLMAKASTADQILGFLKLFFRNLFLVSTACQEEDFYCCCDTYRRFNSSKNNILNSLKCQRRGISSGLDYIYIGNKIGL
jgi:hypothetical protein